MAKQLRLLIWKWQTFHSATVYNKRILCKRDKCEASFRP